MQRSAVIPKTAEELIIMREAGRITAMALHAMREAIRPGISTHELDELAADVIRKHHATPAFLGYPPGSAHPFPATATISINEELVHGIPSRERFLQEGDIVSLDCGAIYKGYVGDSALSVGVGAISEEAQKLLNVTEEALRVGLDQARAGNETSDISRAVQAYVEDHGYSVVREYTGHGVGRTMHEPPQVPNWWPRGRQRVRGWQSVRLEPGITFAVEPMVNVGRPETRTLGDHWTVVTRDGSLCAHFEHTIAIAPSGPPLILTAL
ncbi:MAG TPA: type I methionyl aminopeptidase [Aggregatilinea sp.]|jgi:methionyl aminopeptidase|uniref:type I methionyl aminopeptidase n=1 Tax=Aggregatilinea sp. TaxID=2806333 RepID=UPI002CAAD66D|nr:type I methionyl aminopeptidase [Aggregatilinea sp.]HML22143.1 type I methionyl aminopeptidase [Aggregatilinea sp.]